MVTLSDRLSLEAPVFRPANSRTTAPEASEPSPAPVAGQETVGSAVTVSAVFTHDPKRPGPAASSRTKLRTEVAPSTFKKTARAEERLQPGRTAGAHEPTRAPSVQSPRFAAISLAVKPWGEVYVDGRKIGVTPPLKRFALAPGFHLITITNSSLPSYQTQLAVDPGAQMMVAHDFDCISDREKTCREGFGKGLELNSRFRFETVAAQR